MNLEQMSKSILAGIAISIGCIVFLKAPSPLGAVLFAFGLITVVSFNLNLYTGKVGYIVPDNSKENLRVILLSLIGNYIGCAAVGYLYHPIGNVIQLCIDKLSKSCMTTFLDSALCGIIIFVGVHLYKNHKGMIGIIYGIPVFILCGFEHCIADIFYFANARMFSIDVLIFIGIVILGNAVGAIMISFLINLFRKN